MIPTIKDIARTAGVSTATVSHVLNGTRFVSPPVREQVEKAMRETGYHRNMVARSLRTGRTNLVGFLCANLAAPSTTSIIVGVQESVASAGYRLVLLKPEKPDEQDLSSFMRQGTVDGLILDLTLAPPGDGTGLADAGIPIVVMSGMAGDSGVDTVVVDEEAGAALAMEHLLGLGHKRIGFIGGPQETQSAVIRYDGYRNALAGHRLVYDPTIVAEAPNSRYGGYRAARSIMEAIPYPTALFAVNYTLAAGALLALRDAGLRVPDDVSLVGYDDVKVADLLTPTLTTVTLPWHEMGTQAARMLLERVSGKETGPGRTVILNPILVWRQSTAAPPNYTQ